MTLLMDLATSITAKFASFELTSSIDRNELTIEVPSEHIRSFCLALRDHEEFKFELLVDICGVDYLQYGESQWETESTTVTGFSRAVEPMQDVTKTDKSFPTRFAVVYHLLSLTHNHRLRIRTFVTNEALLVPSVVEIWNVANWFEREAYDLFGIQFEGHPDLRRILTDYGFVGHPFRKDFPLIGEVEPRYDGVERRVIYEPVSIEPRVLVPKVIRKDNRYLDPNAKMGEPHA